MSEENKSWLQKIADAIKPIGTPIALMAIFYLANMFVIMKIADCDLSSGWKSGLLTLVLVMQASVLCFSIGMIIFRVREFLFDRDAHLTTLDVNLASPQSYNNLELLRVVSESASEEQNPRNEVAIGRG
jgi:hypothetical protein